jgi:hypothetical protein
MLPVQSSGFNDIIASALAASFPAKMLYDDPESAPTDSARQKSAVENFKIHSAKHCAQRAPYSLN